MRDAYPELDVQREFIGKMVRIEEERFGATLTVGLKRLNEIVENYKSSESMADLSKIFKENPNARPVGAHVFKPTSESIAQLNDTYGLPVDLAYVVLSQNNVELRDTVTFDGLTSYKETNVGNLSEEEFRDLIAQAVKRLQQNSEIGKTKQKENIKPIYTAMERTTNIRSKFHGYEKTQVEDAKIVALVKDDNQVGELGEGEEGLIVLDETPFYAESGGQVGDAGTIFNGNAQVKVFDTFAPVSGIVLHKSKIEKGSVKVGDTVTAMVDAEKRDATRRNHTATHLVHAALREVLERTSNKLVRLSRRIICVSILRITNRFLPKK
jgi:alanyl-tRNA synthetase